MSDKIAFFCPSLELGGAERKTAILANAFSRRGHQVDVCTSDARGVVRHDIVPPTAIVDFGSVQVRRSLFPLRRYLIENEPRILICIQCHAGLIGILANALSGTKTPVIVVEQSLTLSRLRGKSKWAYYEFRTLIRLLYPRATRIVAISRDVRMDLLQQARISTTPIEVISNPAAIPVFVDNAEALPETWDGWPETADPVIATVGRLVEVKGIPVLLRAFAELRTRRRAQLAIIGDGPDRAFLEKMARVLGIANDTHFLGAKNRPWRYLHRASIFVMASHFEGFGNTLVEALAVGCPVVSTNCPGGPSDILEDGKYGRLVPVGDHHAMAIAIEQTLDHSLDSSLLQQRALDFGEPVIEAYLNLIDRVSTPRGVKAQ